MGDALVAFRINTSLCMDLIPADTPDYIGLIQIRGLLRCNPGAWRERERTPLRGGKKAVLQWFRPLAHSRVYDLCSGNFVHIISFVHVPQTYVMLKTAIVSSNLLKQVIYSCSNDSRNLKKTPHMIFQVIRKFHATNSYSLDFLSMYHCHSYLKPVNAMLMPRPSFVAKSLIN